MYIYTYLAYICGTTHLNNNTSHNRVNPSGTAFSSFGPLCLFVPPVGCFSCLSTLDSVG